MTDYDFECLMCGAQFDAEDFCGPAPESCPECGSPRSEMVEAKVAEENRRINAREER